MYWREVSKCDKTAIAFANGNGTSPPHYSIQTPYAQELGPPGQKMVLMGEDNKALWGSHRPAPWAGIKRMDGFEGHSCFIFRNDGGPLSSTIIREAVGITAQVWGVAPFITYVAINKVKKKRDPGRCFVRAGFRRVSVKAKTKHGPMLRLEMPQEVVAECLSAIALDLSSRGGLSYNHAAALTTQLPQGPRRAGRWGGAGASGAVQSGVELSEGHQGGSRSVVHAQSQVHSSSTSGLCIQAVSSVHALTLE